MCSAFHLFFCSCFLASSCSCFMLFILNHRWHKSSSRSVDNYYRGYTSSYSISFNHRHHLFHLIHPSPWIDRPNPTKDGWPRRTFEVHSNNKKIGLSKSQKTVSQTIFLSRSCTWLVTGFAIGSSELCLFRSGCVRQLGDISTELTISEWFRRDLVLTIQLKGAVDWGKVLCTWISCFKILARLG